MINVFKSGISVLSIVSFLLVGAFMPVVPVNAASGDTTVYVTKTGECYHKSGCSSLRRSKIEKTLKEAVDAGYRPCKNCNPGTLDATTSTAATAAPAKATAPAKQAQTAPAQAATAVDPAVEALKTYKGNTKTFNAYTYYMNYTDLQTALGADGDALLKHYNECGKAEGRVAK